MVYGGSYSVKSYLSLAHHVLQLRITFASHLLQFLQWVKTGIDELHQVLPLHLSCRCHLTEHKREATEFFFVAHGNVAQLLQIRHNLLCVNAEAEHHLGVVFKVKRLKRCPCRKLVDVVQHPCGHGLVAYQCFECHRSLLGLRPDGGQCAHPRSHQRVRVHKEVHARQRGERVLEIREGEGFPKAGTHGCRLSGYGVQLLGRTPCHAQHIALVCLELD